MLSEKPHRCLNARGRACFTAETVAAEWCQQQRPQSDSMHVGRREHVSGVCCIQSSPAVEHQVVTGSYDEHVRLWDMRVAARPVCSAKVHCHQLLCRGALTPPHPTWSDAASPAQATFLYQNHRLQQHFANQAHSQMLVSLFLLPQCSFGAHVFRFNRHWRCES